MRKQTLKFGSLAGVISVIGFSIWPVIMRLIGKDLDDIEAGEIIGYISLFLALSMIFFGIRRIREQSGGSISFKNAFLNGLSMAVVASVIYVVGWIIYYPNFIPDFADTYTQSQIDLLITEGLNPQETQEKIDALWEFNENYKKPHIMAGYTFLEIFPLGVVVALISVTILRRR